MWALEGWGYFLRNSFPIRLGTYKGDWRRRRRRKQGRTIEINNGNRFNNLGKPEGVFLKALRHYFFALSLSFLRLIFIKMNLFPLGILAP